MIDDFPNSEQKEIIDSVLSRQNRITIVRACPGSGKTRLFAEILKNLTINWQMKGTGIAALSFTNIAQEEITKNLGNRLSYPHFIGTLDSFMFRYIIKPFGHLVGLPKEGPRLIPSPLDDVIENPKVKFGPRPQDEGSIFRIKFVNGPDNAPNMVIKDKFSNSYNKIDNRYSKQILEKKQKNWSQHGSITHSDCQYLSSKILKYQSYGNAISMIIAHRFPLILVDEFQDTGWFFGNALVELFRCSCVSGLVVGDPDQAIFEFTGASPKLFDEIEGLPGTKTYPLTRTQRCQKGIDKIVTALSDSHAPTIARDDAEEGRAIVVIHDLEKVQFDPRIVNEICELAKGIESLAILARRGSTIKKLIGFENVEGFRGACRYGEQIDQAVQELIEGKSNNASKIISRILGHFVLDNETPSTEDLRKNNIDIKKWRVAIHEVIAAAISNPEGETWNDWLSRVKGNFCIAAKEIGWIEDTKKLNKSFRISNEKGNVKREFINGSHKDSVLGNNVKLTTKTIHQAKGEGFDCVVLFVPKPHDHHSPCPSKEWWLESPCEERRVAFVAASRAKRFFILCIHKESYSAFKKKVPEFIELFEQVDLTTKREKFQSDLSKFI